MNKEGYLLWKASLIGNNLRAGADADTEVTEPNIFSRFKQISKFIRLPICHYFI